MDEKKVFFQKFLETTVESSKIEKFADLFSIRTYDKNEYFIYETQENSRIGFLKDGIMRSYLIDYDGNEANIRFIQPGGIVSGGFAFHQPSPVSIQSIIKSTVYSADWKKVSQFIRDHYEFMKLLNQFLSNGSQKTTRLLSSFIRLDAKERYLLFIQENPGLIDLIPHHFIANHLGVTAVQLSRIRKTLNR